MSAPAAGRARVGGAPTSPLRLSLAEWRNSFSSAFKAFLADDCPGLAQQIAFSSLLAFFPAVIFLVGLLGLVDAYDDLRDFLAPIAPGDVLDTIDRLQADSTGATASLAFVIGAAGAVWAASGAMGAVIKAVNRAYDLLETRPFWLVRLTAVVLVSLTGLVTAGLFLLIVFGGPLGTAIADAAGLGGAFELLWAILRWPLAFAAVLLFFAFVYAVAPNRPTRRWDWISPGSLVGALGWLALSGLFALYTSLSDSYSRTYGALASGIVLLLWLNYSAFALLFGAELNSELERQAEIRAAGGPNAGLTTPSRRVS
jgi:membrane protein